VNISEAKKAGVKAFNEGRQVAPALNQAFLFDACASSVDTAELLAAYTKGWTVAKLAAAATAVGMTGAPSIAALANITD
jgi:hypothetical protein